MTPLLKCRSCALAGSQPRSGEDGGAEAGLPGKADRMRIRVILILLFIGGGIVHAQTQGLGRYRLVPAEVEAVDGSKVLHELFLLDTQTGKVWRFDQAIGKMRDVPPDESGVENISGLTTGVFVLVERWDNFPVKESRKPSSPASTH